MRKFLPLFLLLLFLEVPAWSATYYVKTGGDDEAAGTSDALAWATIAKVTATAAGGDTVYFRSQDTWTGANPVLVCAEGVTYDGSTYGTGTRATFQASSRASSNGIVQIRTSTVTVKGFAVDANGLSMSGIGIGYTDTLPSGNIANITVQNCEVFNNLTEDTPAEAYYYGIHVSMTNGITASNISILDNVVHDTGHEGIAVYPQTSSAAKVNTATVARNTIYNTGTITGTNRSKPIAVMNDADNVTVEYNYIYNSPAGIAVGSYGLIGYGAPSPDNVIVRFNRLYDAVGISVMDYLGCQGIDGYGEVYGNIVYGGGLFLTAATYNDKSWKIYNNVFVANYSAGLGNYALDSGNYASVQGHSGVEIKNNIFMNTGLRVIRATTGNLDRFTHSNNLIWRTDSQADVAQIAVLSDASAISGVSVTVTADADWTYFDQSAGGTDWTTIFAVNNMIQWSGFATSQYNGRLFIVAGITATQIKCYNIYLDAEGPVEDATVSAEKWAISNISAATLKASVETTSVITAPAFVNGSGAYTSASDFQLLPASPAIDTGYNTSVLTDFAGSPRPQGAGYDIGAYEFPVGRAVGATFGGGVTLK